MVREITGIRVEHKSLYAKAKPKVSADMDSQAEPKLPDGKNEVIKGSKGKECTSPQKQDVLSQSTNLDAEKPEIKSGKTDDQKVELVKPETSADGNTMKKGTPQKLSDATVDKQVCESPLAVETPVVTTSSNSKSPSLCKKSQLSTPLETKNHADDDSCSMTSSTVAFGHTTRCRVTTGMAPTFASDERIQKRKEYYAKLEEKRKALEAERLEYEARTKEEEEAAIKKLRKTMAYKANPVPSFYYEKPPPKKELKKPPTTRPVSPKFGRRKSFSDTVSHSSEDKVSSRAHSARYSLSSQPKRSAPTSSSRKKERDQPNPVKKIIKRSPNISKPTNVDIAVQS